LNHKDGFRIQLIILFTARKYCLKMTFLEILKCGAGKGRFKRGKAFLITIAGRKGEEYQAQEKINPKLHDFDYTQVFSGVFSTLNRKRAPIGLCALEVT
jgi:hypothetical protein